MDLKLELCASVPASSEDTRACVALLETAVELRLDGVEIKLGEDDLPSRAMRNWLKDILPSYGLVIHTHLPYLQGEANLASPHPKLALRAEEVMLRSVNFSSELGCSIVNTHLGVARGPGPHIPRAVTRLKEVEKQAAEMGMEICVENQESNCGGILNAPVDVGKLLGLHTEVNLTYDAGHGNTFGYGVSDFLPVVAPRLRYLHLHDNSAGWDQHLALGKGSLDLPLLFRTLREWGDHPPDKLPTTLELRVADLMTSVDYVRCLLGQAGAISDVEVIGRTPSTD